MKTAARVLLALAATLMMLAPDLARAQSEQAAAVPAARQADNVAIITMEGEIDRWTAVSMERRIGQAEESGADAIVIEIDSPGGEVGAVLEICNAIKASTIPNTVAWVHPDAYSGGAIVALACREIVTSDPASMGDAFPITMDLQGVRGLTPDERTKFLPPLLTEVADSARRHGYSEFLVQAMVVDGIELWSVRDKETGEIWFINEAEYNILFEGDPPRGKPVLTGVTKGRASQQPGLTASPAAENAGEEEAAESPQESPAADDEEGAQQPETPPTPPSDETAFTPASPSVADLSDPISETLETPSQRPTFTPEDRGRYGEPVYITDGSGPIVLRADQLREFGFSSGVIQNDEELRAFFGAEQMIRIDQTWSEAMVRFLMHPAVRGLLIVILLIGLFVEMSSPGMILPGSLAIGALIGLLAPPMLVGMAGWWEIAAIGVGVLCLLVELFVFPGFGVFGIIGLVALFVGMVGTFIPDGRGGLFGGDDAAQAGLVYGVATVLLSTVTAGIAIFFLAKHFGSIPVLGKLMLGEATPDEEDIAAMAPAMPDEPTKGDRGVTMTPLRPSGRIDLGGRTLDAVAQRGYIAQGETIEIVARRGFAWVVRPTGPEPPEPEPGSEPEEDTRT